LWLCALLALVAQPALAAPNVFAPGHEADVLRLIEPYRDQGEITPGIVLTDIAILRERIVFRLQTAPGRQAQVILKPTDLQAAGGPQFACEAPPAAPDLAAAQQALIAAIRSHDRGQVPQWTRHTEPEQPAFRWPQTTLPWLVVAALLWVLLLAALCWPQPARALSRPQRALGWGWGLLVVVVAAEARKTSPFWLLHGDHGPGDIAFALRLPMTNAAASDLLATLGPAWTGAQQVLVALFGATHDGLARVSVLVGATAAGLSFGAARCASQRWLPALLAGLVVACAPAFVRLGHSESPFVFAQWLVAAALWLALRPPSRLGTAGLVAAVALLSLGHPVGIGLAAGTALLAWALCAPPPPTTETQIVWQRAGLALALALAAASGLVLALAHHGREVASRFSFGSSFDVPFAGGMIRHALWLQADWAPNGLGLLALTGLLAWLMGASWPRRCAAVAGVAALALSGLAVSYCLADLVRYQAVWAAPVAVAFALAARLPERLPSVRWLAVLVTLVLLAVGLAALRDRAGVQVLDTAGQAYGALREAFPNQKQALTLVVPECEPGAARCIAAPHGPWSDLGPTVREWRTGAAARACAAQGHLPPETYVLLGPSCALAPRAGQRPPCASLQPFVGATVRAVPLQAPQGACASGVRAECLEFGEAPMLRVVKARCPGS